MSLKDDCTCGHDRCHHYRDLSTGKIYNCLAVHCDCKKFEQPVESKRSVLRPIDQDDGPTTPRTPFNKPHADPHCTCSACSSWFWKSRGY